MQRASRFVSTVLHVAEDLAEPEANITSVYDQTADFTWRTLQRLGVAGADLEDAFQEVYIVVQRKLATFDAQCKITTWIFGICVRVASRQRQRAFRRREVLFAELPEAAELRTPEITADEQRRLSRAQELLLTLSPDKRTAFVLFELEQKSCEEIAGLMEVPLGTVYSRLHQARKQLQAALHRLQQRDERSDV